jgi:hypothetical protein
VIRLLAIAITAAFAVAGAAAHTRSQVSGQLEIAGAAGQITLAVEAQEATRLFLEPANRALPLPAAFAAHMAATITVTADGRACAMAPPRPAPFSAVLRSQLGFRCPDANWSQLTVHYGGFFALARGHIAIFHLRIDGADRGEAVFSKDQRSAGFPRAADAADARPGTFQAFFPIGVTHILEGADHLLFIAGLALCLRRFWVTLGALTGFTLGHSATLVLGAYDAVSVRPGTVEVLIAVTILAAGIEALRRHAGPSAQEGNTALWPILGLLSAGPAAAGTPLLTSLGAAAILGGAVVRPKGRAVPPAVAVVAASGFGLIHGLAFAETLKELLAPGEGVFWALLGFNLGVEAAQAAIAALALGALHFLSKRHPASAEACAFAMACGLLFAGSFWLAARMPFY